MGMHTEGQQIKARGTYTLHLRTWERISDGYLYDSRVLVMTADDLDDLRKRLMKYMKYPRMVDDPPSIVVWKGEPHIGNPPTNTAGSIGTLFMSHDRKSVVWANPRTKKADLVDRRTGALIP